MTPPLDADALLIHAPFLRRLAHSLLSDEAAADDVVQQTFLAALERPPRQAGSLRTWLAAVARNQARERGRRAGRRDARERRVARREAVPSTEEIVEREAVRQEVVEALLSLDEKSRDVLLLRFYEELPPREIAARLELPVETVRTRLKRGLARLADALDARHGGDRRRWALALVPLAVSRAAQAGIGAAVAASVAWLGPVASIAAAGIVALIVAGGAIWWMVDGHDGAGDEQPLQTARADGNGPDALRTMTPEPAAVADARDGDGRDPDLASLTPSSVEPLADQPPPAIEGRVLDGRGGQGLAGVEVRLMGLVFEDPDLLRTAGRESLDAALVERSVRTDAQGRFRAGDLARGLWIVATAGTAERPFAAPGAVLVDVPPFIAAFAADEVRRRCERAGVEPPVMLPLAIDGVQHLDVVAPVMSAVPTRVVDEAGEPVPDAELRVVPPAALLALEASPYEDWTWKRLEVGLHTVTTDDDGRAELALPSGSLVLADAPGHAPVRVEAERDDAGPADPFEVVLTKSVSVDLEGVVTDLDGTPLADALVFVSEFGMSKSDLAHLDDYSALKRYRRTRTDEEGRWNMDGVDRLSVDPWKPMPLARGEYWYAVAVAEGHLSKDKQLKIEGETVVAPMTHALGSGGDFELTLIDRGTLEPAVGARVTVRGPSDGRMRRVDTIELDEDGHGVVERLAHGGVDLVVRSHGHEELVLDTIDWQGDEVQLLVELEPVGWQLTLSVVDEAGTSLDVDLSAYLGRDIGTFVWAAAYASDPREVARAFPHDWRDAMGPGHGATWEDGTARFAFDSSWTADQAWLTVGVGDELLGATHVRRGDLSARLVAAGEHLGDAPFGAQLRLFDHEGAGLGFFADIEALDPRTGATVALFSHEWAHDLLSATLPAPGAYDVRVGLPTGEVALLRDVVFTRDGGMVERTLAEPARLVVGSPSKVWVRLYDDRGVLVDADWMTSERDKTFRVLGDGTYHLVAWTSIGAADVELTLRAGETRRVDLELAPAARLRLKATAVLAGAPFVEVVDDRGRHLFRRALGRSEQQELVGDGLALAFPPGVMHVHVAGPGLESVERDVALVADRETALVLD